MTRIDGEGPGPCPAAAPRRVSLRPGTAAALARLLATALAAVIALGMLGVLAPSARADGDPGSDVLVSQDLFLPADAGAAAPQQTQLADLVRSVNHDGFAIRVAVIARPDDLGAVAALWRKPASYARFLGIELSLAYKQRLLVVMPNGFGFNWPGHSAAAEDRLLAKLPTAADGGLARATSAAVRGLASAAGVRVASQPEAAASSGGGVPLAVAVVLAVLAVLAVAALLAWLAVRRRKRPRGTGSTLRERKPLLRGHPWRLAATGALALAVTVAGGTAYALTRSAGSAASQSLRPSGIPGSISTVLATEMAMDSLQGQAAPGFTLTDQTGRTMSLASFRGKVVVLVFMDDHCTNICPVVSQEFVDAYHDLGPLAGKAVFLAVNVNPFYPSVHAVAAFTNEHRLTAIPDWHYFTGTVPALKAVWRGYHITISAVSPNDVVHTSAVYVIDPRGRERYLADADVEEPQVRYHSNGQAYIPGSTEPAWGRGIASLVRASMAG